MRVPFSWLRSYCDPGLAAEEAADRLTMAGDKLERLHRVGVGAGSEFVTGRVLDAERHPDADRLTVCRVDVGRGEPQTIVCGAPNVAAGQTVAVALPGAIMPDGSTLGEAKLRGVVSSGMILAEDEVGIGEDHLGIMVLDGDVPVGAPLDQHMPIADEVLELEVTPNRPDLMGVYGVARDLHAVTAAPLAPDPTEADAVPRGDDSAEEHVSIEIDPEICLRFTARVFEDVQIGPSPLWLKQRLTAAGQRPISNVVDITNYVMLCTAQPLHAFDLDEVRGGRIVVRRAADGERMVTLDGTERVFTSEMALVCDAEGPSGIAGIMGGQVSEVSDTTTRVLMETATWVGPNIMRTSKALGLRTEASARFEKQLHPEQAIAAQRLAARLMVDLCGARLVPGTVDVYPHPSPPRNVELRLARMEKLLGKQVPSEDVQGILDRLGFAPRPEDGRFAVTVPPWRDSDVQREADLIEEVARIHGLDKLPTTLPARRAAVGRLTPSQRLRRRVEDLLRDRGLDECIAYSFTSPRALERLRLADQPVLRLENPLSEDQSAMRPLLLPGLLDAARHNAAHGRPALALFESAHVYRPSGPLDDPPNGSPGGKLPADERHHLAVLQTQALPGGWRTEARAADFFSARAVLEAVLEVAGVEWRAEPSAEPFLHPGRAASVVAAVDDRNIGWVGELHPTVAAGWDLGGPVAGFEIDMDAVADLTEHAERVYSDVTSFPSVLQDIAVVVPDETPAAAVVAAIRDGGGALLAGVEIFDVYRGEQVGEGEKSLALRLEFRSPDRTLTDPEVAERRVSIEAWLAALGGRLRG
ncbi:MAG: phenylalanyl-tRNA synthetase beta chain [Thermoleophilaceae bacterium]|jgi:phenylalanyl-tRNA synthetase beta chain|nr:phenylalanyl-tRNA synthetase beta chain [Thermoleophilaceae bacterium]